MTFSELLTTSLKEKKISQIKLASQVGISRIQMNRYARGNALPKLEVAIRISRTLGFSLDKLAVPEPTAP